MRSTANPGTDVGRPGEQRDVAAERQPLVADLRRRGEHDVVDPLGRELRVAAEQLAHGLDGHVVRARPREQPVRRRAAERRPDAVDVDHLAKLRHGETILRRRWTTGRSRRERAKRRFADGAARLPSEPDERQRS